jgi:DNA-binding MarR family transcriptional regulator
MARSAVARTKRPAAAGQDHQLQLRTWLRLMASTNSALNLLRRVLRNEFGVTLPVFDMLVQIQRPPLGPTMGELSSRLMVTKGHVTDLAERLEAKGLIARRSNSNDARLQHVYLTQTGEALLARVVPVHRAWIAELMAEMDPANLAQLYELLGAFRASALAAENRETGAAVVTAPQHSDRHRQK